MRAFCPLIFFGREYTLSISISMKRRGTKKDKRKENNIWGVGVLQ
jgi:hypothetical protein